SSCCSSARLASDSKLKDPVLIVLCTWMAARREYCSVADSAVEPAAISTRPIAAANSTVAILRPALRMTHCYFPVNRFDGPDHGWNSVSCSDALHRVLS